MVLVTRSAHQIKIKSRTGHCEGSGKATIGVE
jgi:hypothetical protein